MKETADRKEVKAFIELMQRLDREKQIGLLQMLQGAKLLADPDKQKKQRT